MQQSAARAAGDGPRAVAAESQVEDDDEEEIERTAALSNPLFAHPAPPPHHHSHSHATGGVAAAAPSLSPLREALARADFSDAARAAQAYGTTLADVQVRGIDDGP